MQMPNIEPLKPTAEGFEDLSLTEIIHRATRWLIDRQQAGGYWVGMLESNACMEAQWLLAMHFMDYEADAIKEGLVRSLLNQQRPDGSWETYHDAPQGDVNATVEAYAALRCNGMPPEDRPLRSARQWIFKHQAMGKLRMFTRYWLALIGEWPWEKVAIIPPEIILLPGWFPFNIYNFASWARATMLPLGILTARKACKPLPEGCRLDELFEGGRDSFDYSMNPKRRNFSWESVFMLLDKGLHLYQSFGLTPGREAAIKLSLEWIMKHQDSDGAWGGIQPPWIYSLLALYTEGYPLSHPVMEKGLGTLGDFWSCHKDGCTFIQASNSPVWDTLLTVMALQDCGLKYSDSSSMQVAVEWILQQQVKAPGDWQQKVKGVEPGGWAFERANLAYPDIDDTAVALIVLGRLRDEYPDRERLDNAIQLALDWVLAMQSRNGGWAAFDKDNDKKVITKIPFCDFGEVLDPPSVDVTAHVVEALGVLGMTLEDKVVARAVEFIRAEQEPQGSWFGRWGVNHIYGTGAVLPALRAVGEDMTKPYIQKAADWTVAHQNPDGGWGECCGSYMDEKLRGKGDSTASQTGWALMALLAVDGGKYRLSIERGLTYLQSTQEAGTWQEPHYTGTGFPGYSVGARVDLSDDSLAERLHQGVELSRAFMINYNMYRHYFPLMALGRARHVLQRA
jgi:squalene-hopene/tetraprenyl-beta-curcumene cyclase